MKAIYLGLDCGGSSSRAVAIDSDDNVVFQGQSGSANLASTPKFRLRQNLANATQGCPQATHVCGCFAGLMNPEDAERAVGHLRELFPDAQIRAMPDFAAAYFASDPETDICVISGTGSLVCSWDGEKMVKSGGRGYLLGDEGSAFQYGRDALLAYFANPKGASNTLIKCIVDLFDAEDEPTIVSRLYRSPSPQATLAKLAKPLAQDAKESQPYALQSLTKNTEALARIVRKHADVHMAGKKELKMSLTGGLWKTSTVFVEAFAVALHGTGRIGGFEDTRIAGDVRTDSPLNPTMLRSSNPDRSPNPAILESSNPVAFLPRFLLDRIKTPPVYGAVRLAKEMNNGH